MKSDELLEFLKAHLDEQVGAKIAPAMEALARVQLVFGAVIDALHAKGALDYNELSKLLSGALAGARPEVARGAGGTVIRQLLEAIESRQPRGAATRPKH